MTGTTYAYLNLGTDPLPAAPGIGKSSSGTSIPEACLRACQTNGILSCLSLQPFAYGSFSSSQAFAQIYVCSSENTLSQSGTLCQDNFR